MQRRLFTALPGIPLFLILLITLGGCEKPQIPSIEREDLFSLEIGRLEDQIALYNLEGDRGVSRTNMTMRDGFFYISDNKGAKIVRYTSYGDILFMIYNDEVNPSPLTLKPLGEDGLVTRWAVTYPLLEPGAIAVDSRKHIYVQDRLPYERHRVDNESQALLDNIILHFDEKGRFVEYLGQDGLGGTPFPKIEGIYSSVGDEFAVVCRLPTGWNVYWFSPEGAALYLVELKTTAIPVPSDREMVIPSLDRIACAPDSRRLYIKVDYYRDTFDESTNTRTGNDLDSSCLWVMDVEDGSYRETIELPFYEYVYMEKNRRQTSRMFYSLLGLSRAGHVFLSFPIETGYSLLILSPDQHQRQGVLPISNEELYFNSFDISSEGILSGMLLTAWRVELVWWRTDKFLEEGKPGL